MSTVRLESRTSETLFFEVLSSDGKEWYDTW